MLMYQNKTRNINDVKTIQRSISNEIIITTTISSDSNNHYDKSENNVKKKFLLRKLTCQSKHPSN